MEYFLAEWQHLPASLSPIVFMIGGLPLYWYALFFLLGAASTYFFAGKEYLRLGVFSQKEYSDFAFGIFVSVLLGGKIGFLLFYWWPFISAEDTWLPLAQGVALPGMSFFGGSLAGASYLWWYSKRFKRNFFVLSDTLVVYLPVAFFLGRLGNFFHGELIGRVTQVPWGMYFATETMLRHPSTLYAAFLEGILLFSITFLLRKNNVFRKKGEVTAFFCIAYGILRFTAEFFREPDTQIGFVGLLTINQIFSLLLILAGGVIFTAQSKKE